MKTRLVASVVGLMAAGSMILPSCGNAGTPSAAAAASRGVVGAWKLTVHIDGNPAPPAFDVLYAFTSDGVFTRIDGRNNGPALGAWKPRGAKGADVDSVLFYFDPTTGKRAGTVTATLSTIVDGDSMHGTFAASGTDLTGGPLAGFPKHGTFDGSRITV